MAANEMRRAGSNSPLIDGFDCRLFELVAVGQSEIVVAGEIGQLSRTAFDMDSLRRIQRLQLAEQTGIEPELLLSGNEFSKGHRSVGAFATQFRGEMEAIEEK